MKLKIFNLNNQGNKRNMYTHENTCYSNMNWEKIYDTRENEIKKIHNVLYNTRIMLHN